MALLAIAAVLVLLFGGRWVAVRFAEHEWFVALGQGARHSALLLRTALWQALVFLAALLWYAGHTLGLYRSIGSVHLPRRLGNLDIDEAVPSRTLRGIALGIAALLALATAYTFGDLGDYVAFARAAPPFGLSEPVLGQDATFYLATLPLLELLHLLATVSVLLACLLVIGLYALTGSLTVSRRSVRITPHARGHLVVLLVALALVLAWGFHLDGYEIVGGGGHQGGALSGVDRAIRIPASSALSVIAVGVAVGSALAYRWVRPPLLVSLWATLVVAALLGRLVIPMLGDAWGAGTHPALQQELAQRADDFSKAGFGIGAPPIQRLAASEVAPDSGGALEDALAGTFAWTAEPDVPARLLEETSGAPAHIRSWTISPALARTGGRARPAALAVWQTDLTAVVRHVPRPRWTELHRDGPAWGGEPLAIEAGLRAGPLRFLSGLDPEDSAPPGTPLRRVRGSARFLPRETDLGVIGPGDRAPGEGTPGVLLGGAVRRLLLAWALQAPPLLDDHTSDADRVLYWRDLPSRLSRLYPFVDSFDPPRAALIGDRLVWVTNGYLASGRFPLGEALHWRGSDVNYVAAPYVITVDALTGATRLYFRPGAGPLARGVAEAGRAEALPPDSLEPSLRRDLGYPTGLLDAQVAVLARHGPGATPAAPLSAADTGAAAQDAALLQPTLALLALDAGRVRPWQILPLSDPRAGRLSLLVAGATTDMGELQLRVLAPQSALMPTPAAAALRIGSTPAVMASAAAGAEGAPRRGPVLIMPAAGTVAYAQLLYAAPDRPRAPPRPAALIVLAGNRVGVGSDPGSAVRSLLRGDAVNARLPSGAEDLAEVRSAFLAADSASRAGDWERFGRSWTRLRRALHLEPAPERRP